MSQLSSSAPVGVAAPRDRRVTINCGGTLSQISLSLLQAHPLTLLARLSASLPAVAPAYTASAGELFFDRDPASFGVVLNWYRYGKLVPPASLPHELLADDIVYFALPLLSDAARQTSASAAASEAALASPSFAPGLSQLHSYAVSPRAGGTGGFTPMPAVSRAASQLGSDPSAPALLSQPSFTPQLSHTASFHAPMTPANYMSVDESDTDGASGTVPVLHILPPTPPVLSTVHSAAAPAATQLSGSGPTLLSPMGSLQRTLSPTVATNYLSLGAEDVSVAAAAPIIQPAAPAVVASAAPQQPAAHSSLSDSAAPTSVAQPALAKAISQPTAPSDDSTSARPAAASTTPSHASASAASAVAVPSPTAAAAPSVVAPSPAAAAPAPALAPVAAPAPRPRVPFDLAIEMLSCFKDVNRAQAQALLDAPTPHQHAGSDYCAVDGAPGPAAASGGDSGGAEGSYLFRYCNDPDERLADGSVNRDLFVLSYLHQRKMYNTKIFRHFIGAANALAAPTLQGYMLSDEKHPTDKQKTHTSVIALTHAIIGTHARAVMLE